MRQLRPTTPAPLVVLSSFAILMAAIAPAIAESTPAAQPPSNPPPAAPGSTPGGAPTSPSTQSALKLAGLVTFVANSCPKLQPNYPRFEEAINALGLTKQDLEKIDLKSGYLAYAARYNSDVKTSCERADAQFGPHGTTLGGLFDPR